MAERQEFQRRTSSGGAGLARPVLPQVQIDVAERFAAKMGQFSDYFGAQADQATAVAATKSGAIAGQNPEFKPKLGTSIATDAYNRAATAVYMSGLEINARKKLLDLHRENPANPKALTDQAQAYSKGVISNLERDMPELVPEFTSSLERNLLPLVNDAHVRYQEQVTQQAGAEAITALDFARDGALQMARTLPYTDAATADLALERQSYIQRLVGYGPASEFSYEGQTYGADNARPSLFTVDEIAKQVKDFDDSLTVERAMGEYNRLLSREGVVTASVAAEKFRLADTPGLAPDVKEAILDRMTTDLARANRAQSMLDEQARATLKSQEDATAKDGYRLQADGKLDWSWVDHNADSLSKEDYKAFVKSLSGGAEDDNIDVVLGIEEAMRRDEDAWPLIREAFSRGQITAGRFNDLRNRNETFKDADYKANLHYLDDMFGGQVVASKWDDVAINGTEAKRRFDEWYRGVKQQTGAPPPYADQRDKANQLVVQYLDINKLTRVFRDTAPRPSPQYRVPGADGITLDTQATAARIFAAYPEITADTPPSEYPRELTDELSTLTEYEAMLDQLNILKAARDAAAK